MRRWEQFLLAAAACLALLPIQTRAASLALPDEEIRKILADRIDKNADGVGAVVGVVDAQGPRVVAYGKREAGRPEMVDRDSVFAIASLSKIFTSLILADMVERGEVALDDPAEKYLGIRMPERGGRRITLADLATHTSGLPRDAPIGPDGNPTPETVQFLATYKLTHDIGTHFAYSNIGVVLLGDALARRAGLTYAQLLQAYVARPLGLRNTSSGLGGAASADRATGHDTEFEPLPADNLEQYGGAGSIQSSASDLATVLSAFLGYTKSPLAAAMSSMFDIKRSRVPWFYLRGLATNINVHLGWLESKEGGSLIRWADGAVPGYRSFLGIDAESRIGVAVLANADSVGVEDIGFHILNPKAPLLGPRELHKHKEISLDAEVLNRYAGRYQFPEQKATVKRVRDHLTMSGDVDGGTPIAYFAETERDFYSRDGFYEMHFHTDRKGRVKGFTFRNSSFSKEVMRIEE
jgi:D-alanyl-D-alanine-carboxypeptidase/D-alanyl-D-alanine-endopeptidase